MSTPHPSVRVSSVASLISGLLVLTGMSLVINYTQYRSNKVAAAACVEKITRLQDQINNYVLETGNGTVSCQNGNVYNQQALKQIIQKISPNEGPALRLALQNGYCTAKLPGNNGLQ